MASREERLIVGLMSGTSLDGLDVALCRFRGEGLQTAVQLLSFRTVPYSEDIKARVQSVFAKKQVDLQQVCLLNAWLGVLHAEMVLSCLQEWKYQPGQVDLIASHGQTIYHAPKSLHNLSDYPNATLQIGDGDHIAVRTGIITLSDFRQKHIAAGGEGAPLAVYGDYLLFSRQDEDRILLNMGGIANFTFLPGDLDAQRIFSTDVGPGNTLIDAFTRRYFPGKAFDENGAIAASGTINHSLLEALLDHPFFAAPFPKTTGPELFSIDYVQQKQAQSNTPGLRPQDLIATLTRLSAEGIAHSIRRSFTDAKPVIYMSGGGMHNRVIVKGLQELLLGYSFRDTAALGVLPDAKEAVLFAVLANEAVAGGRTNFGDLPNVTMGKVSFPS
jgi:anhydro-N-acetylmuramic acid kinase